MSVGPLATDAKRLLDDIAASPRGAGTAGEARARRSCAAYLEAAGYAVREAPFEYSAFPGRWATPLAGLGLLATVAGTGHFGFHGAPRPALAALVAGLVGVGLFGWWSGTRGILDAPWLRRRGVNLVATRGTTTPALWLVAHVDSKSQPIPIGVRAGAIVLAALVCIALAALTAGALAGAEWSGAGDPAWIAATVVGVVAALPIAATTVGDRSPGALDNASGVVAILLAAGALPRETTVGVLVTSAEELGLAGTRAWAREWARAHPAATAINCDGVDDGGRLTVMRARGGDAVASALAEAGTALGAPVRIRGLIPGVLVDAVALADAGWRTATVSRGTLRTLMRIHGAGDTPDRLHGTGMAEAGAVIAEAARRLAARATHANERVGTPARANAPG